MFAIDEETRALSLARSGLVFRCGYIEPVQEGWQLREQWREKLVPISELTLDVASQTVFYFDHDSARKRVEQAVCTVSGRSVLDEFRALVEDILGQHDARARWRELKRQLPGELSWPLDTYGGHFFTAVAFYLSAREGRGVGWNYSLIQVAHLCSDRYPYFLPILEESFRAFGRDGIFADGRYTQKWRLKKDKVAAGTLDDSAKVHLDRLQHYRTAMEWLMPEIRWAIARMFAQLSPNPNR